MRSFKAWWLQKYGWHTVDLGVNDEGTFPDVETTVRAHITLLHRHEMLENWRETMRIFEGKSFFVSLTA